MMDIKNLNAHAITSEKVENLLETSSVTGLTEAQIEVRLEKYGRNELIKEKGKTAWQIFIGQFKDFLIYLLVFAIIISIIIPFAAMIFLIIWFWYYAEPFNVWQNIAVLLVILLAMGGILGVIWTRWSMKHGHEMKKFEKIGEEIGKKIEEAVKDKKEDESKDKSK